jgi:phosphatidylserine decarboxylase
MPGLFVRNERLVFTIDTAGGGRVWLVMVGALNVGKIQTPLLPGFYSNHGPRQGDPLCHQVWSFAEGFRLESGDEIGTFMLGSTVVVVMDKLSLPRNGFDHLSSNQPLRVGQSLESSSDANGT